MKFRNLWSMVFISTLILSTLSGLYVKSKSTELRLQDGTIKNILCSQLKSHVDNFIHWIKILHFVHSIGSSNFIFMSLPFKLAKFMSMMYILQLKWIIAQKIFFKHLFFLRLLKMNQIRSLAH